MFRREIPAEQPISLAFLSEGFAGSQADIPSEFDLTYDSPSNRGSRELHSANEDRVGSISEDPVGREGYLSILLE